LALDGAGDPVGPTGKSPVSAPKQKMPPANLV